MAQEAQLWRSAKKQLPGYWERIEDSLASGFPDCVGIVNGVTKTIELKRQLFWQSPYHDLEVSIVQALWHTRWYNKGGISYILAQVDEDIMLLSPHLMKRVYKRHKNEFLEMSIARGWPKIKEHLLKN